MIGGIHATPGRCLLEVLGQLVENVSKLHEPIDNVLPKTEDKAQRKEFGRRIACLVSKAAPAETVSGNQGAGSARLSASSTFFWRQCSGIGATTSPARSAARSAITASAVLALCRPTTLS